MHDGLFLFFADGRSALYSDKMPQSLLDLTVVWPLCVVALGALPTNVFSRLIIAW
jgi:hypothetical protein